MLRREVLVPAHAPHCCVVPGGSRTRARRPGGVELPRGGRCWSRPVAAGFLLPPWLSPAMGRRRRPRRQQGLGRAPGHGAAPEARRFLSKLKHLGGFIKVRSLDFTHRFLEVACYKLTLLII
ncbi:unnamed protein product [Caretta caretta]